MPRPRTPALLALAAMALAVVPVWSVLEEPRIERYSGSGVAEVLTCAAPYETVLGADSVPPGGPEADRESIGAACRSAADDQIALAIGVGVMALVVAARAVVIARRRDPPPRSTFGTWVAEGASLLLLGLAVALLAATLLEDTGDLGSGDLGLGVLGFLLAAVCGAASAASAWTAAQLRRLARPGVSMR